jgi:hypothetical protein
MARRSWNRPDAVRFGYGLSGDAQIALEAGEPMSSEREEVMQLYRWIASHPTLTWNSIVVVAVGISELVPLVCFLLKRLA